MGITLKRPIIKTCRLIYYYLHKLGVGSKVMHSKAPGGDKTGGV